MDGNAIEEELSMQPAPQQLPPSNKFTELNDAQTPETAVPQGLPGPGPVIISGEENASDEREQNGESLQKQKSQVEMEEDTSMHLGDHYEIEMATGKKIAGIIYFIDNENLLQFFKILL